MEVTNSKSPPLVVSRSTHGSYNPLTGQFLHCHRNRTLGRYEHHSTSPCRRSGIHSTEGLRYFLSWTPSQHRKVCTRLPYQLSEAPAPPESPPPNPPESGGEEVSMGVEVSDDPEKRSVRVSNVGLSLGV